MHTSSVIEPVVKVASKSRVPSSKKQPRYFVGGRPPKKHKFNTNIMFLFYLHNCLPTYVGV